MIKAMHPKLNGVNLSVQEHHILHRTSIVIDKEREIVYCGCMYKFLFSINNDANGGFEGSVDMCFRIARERVTAQIEATAKRKG